MPVYCQTERTVAHVTTKKRVRAKNRAEAEELFDNGDGFEVSEEVGAIQHTLDSTIEQLAGADAVERPAVLRLEINFGSLTGQTDELYASEVARIAGMIGEGYREGEVNVEDDNEKEHRGWWKVVRP